ncbi:MAG: histidine--tRNA ligase, partial [Lentisphaerae bacterium]
MYTFKDAGGRDLTLRPEGTAGVIRALANLGFPPGTEYRVFYSGPMFRGERPAAGRKRQFHQVGVEAVGKISPLTDVECILMLLDYLEAIGIHSYTLLINTRGTREDRKQAVEVLKNYFAPHIDSMCEDCRRRFHTNTWRILDCKEPACQDIITHAPALLDSLSDESRDYFQQICHYLDRAGIAYRHENRLVRGLDYYEHTVWEVVSDDIGAQSALAGGGRYLITPPGANKPVPGVGFAAGMERLLMAQPQVEKAENTPVADVYLISLGEQALDLNFMIARNLRRRGEIVMMETEPKSMKAQMRAANRVHAQTVYILGDNEIANQCIIRRNMETGEQEELPLSPLLNPENGSQA